MALPAPAQVIADDIDTKISTIKSSIDSTQSGKITGRYYQLLHLGNIPEDGSIVVANKLGDSPSDRSESWTSLGFSAVQINNLKCSIRVDEYLTPENIRGYVLILQFISAGITYTRGINVGPETWRTHTWR